MKPKFKIGDRVLVKWDKCDPSPRKFWIEANFNGITGRVEKVDTGGALVSAYVVCEKPPHLAQWVPLRYLKQSPKGAK